MAVPPPRELSGRRSRPRCAAAQTGAARRAADGAALTCTTSSSGPRAAPTSTSTPSWRCAAAVTTKPMPRSPAAVSSSRPWATGASPFRFCTGRQNIDGRIVASVPRAALRPYDRQRRHQRRATQCAVHSATWGGGRAGSRAAGARKARPRRRAERPHCRRRGRREPVLAVDRPPLQQGRQDRRPVVGTNRPDGVATAWAAGATPARPPARRPHFLRLRDVLIRQL